jgi:hypothetical protein
MYCYSNFLVCSPINNSRPCLRDKRIRHITSAKNYAPIVYGGFITLEFVRDVELQTPQYVTTQENIAMFMNQTYNSKEQVHDWGRPVCLVNSLFHDMELRYLWNMPAELYFSNVEWYLGLLSRECEHVIWLGSVAPLDKVPGQYPHPKEVVMAWCAAVREIIKQKPELRAVYVDVYDASIQHEHRDNLHMRADWFQILATFFMEVVSTKCRMYAQV